jgi:CRP/FNR family transcriptional regulator, cyclic AMP receptor protein
VETSRLAAIPLFSQLDEADLAVAASAATEQEVAEGDEIVTEGDFGYALYAIETGDAEVTSDGVRIATLGPGDVFGEMAVLVSGRRTATVTATSPMRLIALFKRDVWALEQRAPETANRLRALIEERRRT